MFHEHVNQVIWQASDVAALADQLSPFGYRTADIRRFLQGDHPPGEVKVKMLAYANSRLATPALIFSDGMGTTWTVYPTRRTPEEQERATRAALQAVMPFRASCLRRGEIRERPAGL